MIAFSALIKVKGINIKMKKTIFLVLAVTGILLAGCKNTERDTTIEKQTVNEDISENTNPTITMQLEEKPQNDSKLITIILPMNLINIIGGSAEEQLSIFQNGDEQDVMITNGYVNETGGLTLEMTEDQLVYWKTLFTSNLNDLMEDESNMGIIVKVNDSYDEIIYTLSKDTAQLNFSIALQSVNAYVGLLQIFGGTAADNWHTKNVIINKDNGKVVKEWINPDEEMNINPEDWE